MSYYYRLSDEGLFDLAKTGDECAFTVLFQRFRHLLIFYAYRAQPNSYRILDEWELENVFSFSFFEAFRTYDGSILFRNYLTVVLSHEITRAVTDKCHRRFGVLGSVSLDDELMNGEECYTLSDVTPYSDDSGFFDAEEVQLLIEKAGGESFPKGFDPLSFVALSLRYQGFSNSEIAERIGTSSRKVKSLLAAIKKTVSSL